MITLTIISAIVILFLTGILFIPLSIVIRTKTKEYYVKLPGYFRIDLILREEIIPLIKVKLFLFSFHIEPGKKSTQSKENKPKKTRNNKNKKVKGKALQFFLGCLKQFKREKIQADIDTGNYPLNAQLIPIANTINGENINININFENRNQVEFITKTRLYRLLVMFIKYSMFNK